jgi:hypothetical protein
MPDCRVGRKVTDIGLLTRVPLVQQPAKTTLAIPVIIPVKIVPAHLVDNDTHDQLGSRYRLRHGRQQCNNKHKEEIKASHYGRNLKGDEDMVFSTAVTDYRLKYLSFSLKLFFQL